MPKPVVRVNSKPQNPYVITSQMIDDILVAAFEGGINYWAIAVEVVGEYPEGTEFASEVVSKGSTLLITIDPELDDEVYSLDLKAIKRGIRAEAKRQGLTPLAFYDKHDAGDADNAVQFALFKELIYG